MTAVTLEGGTSILHAAQDGEYGVEQRNCSGQDRIEHGGLCAGAGAIEIERQEREGKSEKSATGVVRNYLFRVFDKLGISSRVELVLYCLQYRQSTPRSMAS